MNEQRKGFTIRAFGDVPQKALDALANAVPGPTTIERYASSIVVDAHGRVIRSPETEAEIAALKARIKELEGASATIPQSVKTSIVYASGRDANGNLITEAVEVPTSTSIHTDIDNAFGAGSERIQ